MTVATLILSGDSGLSRYLNEIKQFPILSAEENSCLPRVTLSMRIGSGAQAGDQSPPSCCKNSDAISRLWSSSS